MSNEYGGMPNAPDRRGEPRAGGTPTGQLAEIGPVGKLLRRFGVRMLYLLTITFVLAGLLLIITDYLVVKTGAWKGVLQALGISFISFGLTTIILMYFTTTLFEDQVTDRIDQHMRDHLGAVDQLTRESLDRLPTLLQLKLMEVSERLERFVPLFGNCSLLGLENIYLTRTEALQDFSEYMTSELSEMDQAIETNDEPARLWFVSSSMKGFLDISTAKFDGPRLLGWAAALAARKRLDLKILMTHPSLGDERAAQETRAKGDIPREIMANLAFLKGKGVEREAVRFVLHTPTVFAIATKDVMLLNPYPYGTEAFRSFCVTVRKSSAIGANRARERDIYEQYEHYHFGEPWAHAEQIDPNVWDDLGVSSPALDPDLGGGPRTPLNNANRTVGPTVTDASLGRPG